MKSLNFLPFMVSLSKRKRHLCNRLKTVNDLILCVVDISEECLKSKKLSIPDTYKDTVLACYELLGEIVLKIAPLTKHRNEMIHQYLKVNWQNIVTVKKKIPDIQEFSARAKNILLYSQE